RRLLATYHWSGRRGPRIVSLYPYTTLFRSTVVRTDYSTIARSNCIACDRQTGAWCFLQFNGLTYSYRRRTIVANGYCKGRTLSCFHTSLIRDRKSVV